MRMFGSSRLVRWIEVVAIIVYVATRSNGDLMTDRQALIEEYQNINKLGVERVFFPNYLPLTSPFISELFFKHYNGDHVVSSASEVLRGGVVAGGKEWTSAEDKKRLFHATCDFPRQQVVNAVFESTFSWSDSAQNEVSKAHEIIVALMHNMDKLDDNDKERMQVEILNTVQFFSTVAEEGKKELEAPSLGELEVLNNQNTPLKLALPLDYSILYGAVVRNLFHSILRYQKQMQDIVTDLQFWMVDLGMFSNSNSPKKHFKGIVQILEVSGKIINEVLDENTGLQALLEKSEGKARGGTNDTQWGHDDESGIFTNTTIVYRSMFPRTALMDKGILRSMLRLVEVSDEPPTLIDLGAMDGQYAGWLNDTGLFETYGAEGSSQVDRLTDGRVFFADLTKDLRAQTPNWIREKLSSKSGKEENPEVKTNVAYDYVLCIEVAEHIPPTSEQQFLRNLQLASRKALIISWAPPHIVGEGHVNTASPEESQRRIEALGFKFNSYKTEILRQRSEIPWIKESVAWYDTVSSI